MAYLDLTDLTLDPEFSEQITINRRNEQVNSGGISTLATKQFTATGVVYPTGANSMVRQDAYTRGQKSIKVITKFRIQGPSIGYQPDVIVYRGDMFVVKTTDDFTQYGAGFIVAECVSMDLVEQPDNTQF